jgi:hypothetical protein
MPRPKRDYASLQARLTAKDLEFIATARTILNKPTFSSVVEEALERFITATDEGRMGFLTVPTEDTPIRAQYLISPALDERLGRMKKRLRFSKQQILRAALAQLERDLAS